MVCFRNSNSFSTVALLPFQSSEMMDEGERNGKESKC